MMLYHLYKVRLSVWHCHFWGRRAPYLQSYDYGV